MHSLSFLFVLSILKNQAHYGRLENENDERTARSNFIRDNPFLPSQDLLDTVGNKCLIKN